MSQLPRLPRSRSDGRANDEESIYNVAGGDIYRAQPKVRTYNIPAPQPQPGGQPGADLPPAHLPPTPKAKSHADSSQISAALNPVHGPRDAMVRAGQKPYNHARSNITAVKEASQLNALRKMSSDKNMQVQSGVRSTSAPTRRQLVPVRQPSDDGGQAGRNFLMENRLGAGAPARPPRPAAKKDDGQQYLAKKDYGRVPQYLQNRKYEMQLMEEEKERQREMGQVPPGMRVLPEEERLETLAILQRNKVEVERALQTLPIIIETPSAIRRKDDLERRLREIEDAFKVFSRPKVLVHS